MESWLLSPFLWRRSPWDCFHFVGNPSWFSPFFLMTLAMWLIVPSPRLLMQAFDSPEVSVALPFFAERTARPTVFRGCQSLCHGSDSTEVYLSADLVPCKCVRCDSLWLLRLPCLMSWFSLLCKIQALRMACLFVIRLPCLPSWCVWRMLP